MWRKQDGSKAPSSEVELAVAPPAVTTAAVTPSPIAATSTSLSPASSARQAAPPAGHITKGLIFKGEITGGEDLLVEGEVHGQVRIANGRVTIAPSGRLVAWVEAREIVVRGTIKGNLRASEQVQISSSGTVIGDIITPRIAIDEGAGLRGNVDTTRAETRGAARSASTAAVTSAGSAKPEMPPAVLQAAMQNKKEAPRA